MAGVVRVIWGDGEANYFCDRDWMGQITLKRLKKIAGWRIELRWQNRHASKAASRPHRKAVDDGHRLNFR
jgi:hypothetical protein